MDTKFNEEDIKEEETTKVDTMVDMFEENMAVEAYHIVTFS